MLGNNNKFTTMWKMLSSLVSNFWNINRRKHIREIFPRSLSWKWDDLCMGFRAEMNTFSSSLFYQFLAFFQSPGSYVSFPSGLSLKPPLMRWCFCLSYSACVNYHYAICHYDKTNFRHSPTQDETDTLNFGRILLRSPWLLHPKMWNSSFPLISHDRLYLPRYY